MAKEKSAPKHVDPEMDHPDPQARDRDAGQAYRWESQAAQFIG